MPRPLKFRRLDGLLGAIPRQPTRAHDDDAGFDLYVSDTTIVGAHSFVDIPTGIAVEIPQDCWGLLTGRSSTLRNRGLLVINGVIDPGYRGELYSAVWNLTDHDVTIETGERLAQLIIMPNTTRSFAMVEVESLSAHERGTKGFGSSGK